MQGRVRPEEEKTRNASTLHRSGKGSMLVCFTSDDVSSAPGQTIGDGNQIMREGGPYEYECAVRSAQYGRGQDFVQVKHDWFFSCCGPITRGILLNNQTLGGEEGLRSVVDGRCLWMKESVMRLDAFLQETVELLVLLRAFLGGNIGSASARWQAPMVLLF